MKVTNLLFVAGFLLASLSSFSQSPWTPVSGGIWYPEKVGIGTSFLQDPDILQLYQGGVIEASERASIRLTVDGLGGSCKGIGQISVSDGIGEYSNWSNPGDLVLRTHGLQGQNACRGDIILAARSLDGQIRFTTWDGANEMEQMILKNNGYLGVGISLPAERLDVGGNIKLSEPSPWGHKIYTGSNQRLSIFNNTDADNSYGWLEFWGQHSSPDVEGQLAMGGKKIVFFTNTDATTNNKIGNINMEIQSDGKVLIADGNQNYSTTPSGYRLFVQDGIMTEKLMVTLEGSTQWPDYVFAADYELPKVEEVEEFIEENHHLPGVPSAAEIDGGINVADMDAALLEQIEQLWLHVIELKKENELLKTKIEDNDAAK